MNGFCGSFSIFSSARYLITKDEDYLYAALAYPLAGLLFDFFDGKVARWRKSSSLIGQELDSLADLVSNKAIAFSDTTWIRCDGVYMGRAGAQMGFPFFSPEIYYKIL